MTIFTFTDLMNSDSSEPRIIEAEITLLAPENGGRKSPVYGEYSFRPNHNFGDINNRCFYIGQIELDEKDVFLPGETKTLMVTFIDGKGLEELLTVGREWSIQRGSDVIGKGIVKHVF